MEDLKAELAVIRERIQNGKDQTARLISHIESEQRVSNNHEKRISNIEDGFKRTQGSVDKIEGLLFNTGKGMVFGLDRLQRDSDEKKDTSRWNAGLIISIISALISLGAIVLMYLDVIKK